MNNFRAALLALALTLLLAACNGGESDSSAKAPVTEPSDAVVTKVEESATTDKPVTVYSSRNEHLIKPVFDAYTAATGKAVRFITDKEGPLLARLEQEGASTPADLLLTVDAGNLWQASEMGLLMPAGSETLQSSIPESLRDPDGRWFGLSVRARTIFYNPSQVSADELSGYADLAEHKWQGKLCLRTSKKVYNQSLVAMLIAQLGAQKTESVVRGWVDNLAEPPFPNDTQMLEAIADGRCAIGIANTYYFGRLQKDQPAINVAIFWPDQDGDGVHVNVAGGGIVAASSQPEEARKLLEWMASPAAQNLFADDNLEYPANPAVEPADAVAEWGDFKASSFNLAQAGALQRQAVMLMDRAGYQ